MVIDSFPFFNEFDILKGRIAYLSDRVSRFVVVESSHSHTGFPKDVKLQSWIEENFPELVDRFSIYENYEYLSIKDVELGRYKFSQIPSIKNELEKHVKSENACAWINDAYQRELLLTVLRQHATKQDVVMLSDVDEIPSYKFINSIKEKSELNFAEMQEYVYSESFRVLRPWIGSVASDFTRFENIGMNQARFWTKRGLSSEGVNTIPDGGWHLTSFGDEASLLKKMRSYGHAELNTSINRKLLSFRIRRGWDLFGRDLKIEYSDSSVVPECISNALDNPWKGKFIDASISDFILNHIMKYIDAALRKFRSLLFKFLKS